jgi:hypothetical protein
MIPFWMFKAVRTVCGEFDINFIFPMIFRFLKIKPTCYFEEADLVAEKFLIDP